MESLNIPLFQRRRFIFFWLLSRRKRNYEMTDSQVSELQAREVNSEILFNSDKMCLFTLLSNLLAFFKRLKFFFNIRVVPRTVTFKWKRKMLQEFRDDREKRSRARSYQVRNILSVVQIFSSSVIWPIRSSSLKWKGMRAEKILKLGSRLARAAADTVDDRRESEGIISRRASSFEGKGYGPALARDRLFTRDYREPFMTVYSDNLSVRLPLIGLYSPLVPIPATALLVAAANPFPIRSIIRGWASWPRNYIFFTLNHGEDDRPEWIYYVSKGTVEIM